MELSSEKSLTEQQDWDCWQDPIEDVKEMIVERMSFSGRVRLSSLCKSWRLVSMRKDIPVPPQLPWLVHFQADPSWDVESYLSFSSLSEDNKIFKLTLPKPLIKSNCPREFYASSKGWLIMLKHDKSTVMQSFVFLVNPITGTQHLLPSQLKTIPSYKPYSKQSSIIDRFALSSPDISECIVAAVINQREVALCRPSIDKRWTCFHVLGEDDKIYIDILMFSTSGVLYALVIGLNAGVNADLHLKFGDHNVEFKLIYLDNDWLIGDIIGMNPQPPETALFCIPFLLESINNEVLLICQILIPSPDVADNEEEGNNNGEQGEENNEENNEETHTNLTTSFFRVYKMDPDNNNNYRGHRVENLGEQIVFVADQAAKDAVSLPATDFKDLRGNCIYFASRESCSETPQLTHYMGIFYLDSGKIERSQAILEVPDNLSELGWFTPSLW